VVGLLRYDVTIDTDTATELVDTLEAARQDPRIAAVVIELSTPGGLATSSENIYYTMLKLRDTKPIVVVVDGLAVSGGYYMAAAANRIYAPASSYVGNVGTRGPKPTDPSLSPEEMSSGPYKLSGGSRFDRVQQLDLVKDAFVNNVVFQRQQAAMNPLKLPPAELAEARIYLGSEAAALGLIDAEGSRSDAITGAAELAGVRNYRTVDLRSYLGRDPLVPPPSFDVAVKAMVERAPPDAVFLLDSRIPLPGLSEPSALERHLLQLRGLAPVTPQTDASQLLPAAPDTLSAPAGKGS
jgi:protease-4